MTKLLRLGRGDLFGFFGRVCLWLLMGYSVVVWFPHNAALKNVIYALLLLVIFVGSVYCFWKKLDLDFCGKFVIPMLIWGGLLLLHCILFSGYSGYSMLALYRYAGPLLILCMAFSLWPNAREGIPYILASFLLGYVIRVSIALAEYFYFGEADQARQFGYSFKGLAVDSIFGVILASFCYLNYSKSRWAFLLISILGVCLLMISGSRAPLAAAAGAVFFLTIVMDVPKKKSVVFLVVLGITAAGIGKLTSVGGSRVESLMQKQTYLASDGFGGRVPIWYGVIDMAKECPWLGHGFGWKKIGETAVSEGYIAKWKSYPPLSVPQGTANYFSMATEKVNPHNVYLQLLYEVGGIGLAVYVCICVYLFTFPILRRISSSSQDSYHLLGSAYVLAVMIVGIADGILLGSGVGCILLAAAYYKQDVSFRRTA